MGKLKTYRSVLNFNKSEILVMDYAGIQTGVIHRPVPGTFNVIEMFGMFGNGNNANTYYPDVSASSLIPKAEDFVDVPFRLLSATIVGANSWKATNFMVAGVLKPSAHMLNNKPIFFDHEQDIMNWLGLTINPYWQDAYTANDGTKIPAGINGTLRIDGKSNPKVARGLLMGAIGSDSVTVQFDWQPSHKFKNDEEFYSKIGTMHEDGKMITRNATKIIDYHETSLVWLGADPFAKRQDAIGNLVNIDKASIVYSKDAPLTFDKIDASEKARLDEKNIFTINYCLDENIISLSNKENFTKTKVTLTADKTDFQMKNFLLAFIAAFGTKLNLSFSALADGQELTAEQVTELSTGIQKLMVSNPTDATELTAFKKFCLGLKLVNDKGEFTAFDAKGAGDTIYYVISSDEQTRVYNLAKEAELLKPSAVLGTEYLTLKRSEAIRLYKTSVGDAADAAVEALMNKADSKELDGLLKQYTKGAMLKFSATCSKCNSSEHIEMRSSIAAPVDNTDTNTVSAGSSSKSVTEIAASKRTSMYIGRN